MVDNGVLRLNEAAQVDQMLRQNLGVNLTVVDSSDLFLKRLEGVEDPEQKRKIIGNTFIHVFEDEAAKMEAEAEKAEAEGEDKKGKIEWLLQGTLYPDVIESISFKGPSATIKTHHNVGGLLKDMKLKLIEPLRELFKGSFVDDVVPSVEVTARLISAFYFYRRSQGAGSPVEYPRSVSSTTSIPGTRLGHSYPWARISGTGQDPPAGG